jgi:hypothetical protein
MTAANDRERRDRELGAARQQLQARVGVEILGQHHAGLEIDDQHQHRAAHQILQRHRNAWVHHHHRVEQRAGVLLQLVECRLSSRAAPCSAAKNSTVTRRIRHRSGIWPARQCSGCRCRQFS